MKKLTAILACILLGILLMPAFLQPPGRDEAQEESLATQGARLLEAFAAYQQEFGAYPAGSPEAMLRELRGENEKQIVFFETPPESVNEKGELLDPWGNPFRITFEPETQMPLIHSAGRNRLFEAESANGGDDYRSWRARE
jgi:hypothetical protein